MSAKYKGKLEGFPEEIVELMLKNQEKQGNKRDASVFERHKLAGKPSGGFTWVDSIEGWNFWNEILCCKKFNLVMEKENWFVCPIDIPSKEIVKGAIFIEVGKIASCGMFNLPIEMVQDWKKVIPIKQGDWVILIQAKPYQIKSVETKKGIFYVTDRHRASPYTFDWVTRLATQKEIDEVEKEPKEITLSNGQVLTVTKNQSLEIDGVEISKKSLENLFPSTFYDWNVNIQSVKFDIGCYKNLTLEDLNLLIDNM